MGTEPPHGKNKEMEMVEIEKENETVAEAKKEEKDLEKGGGVGVEERKFQGNVLGCFSILLGIINCATHAEISVVMTSIELAHSKGWHHLWLECDSSLVVSAFK